MQSAYRRPENPITRSYRSARQRRGLSAPLKLLMQMGLLSSNQTVFDYGCGMGDDVQNLRALGFTANGWDPNWAPSNPVVTSDVVALHYVIDCIVCPTERQEAIRRAFATARQYLSIAVRRDKEDYKHQQSDGNKTKWQTFRKVYRMPELEHEVRLSINAEGYAYDRGGYLLIPCTDEWRTRIKRVAHPIRRKND